MRRLIAASSAILLALLVSQAVLAQYEPIGPVTLSSTTPTAGGPLTVSGSGFAPNSDVQIIIESDPILLATVTADGSGAFSVEVTIPASLSGEHLIIATGIDPAGSVRVLGTTVVIAPAPTVPATSTGAAPEISRPGSDPVVFAVAGAGIVILTGVLLLATRRRESAS